MRAYRFLAGLLLFLSACAPSDSENESKAGQSKTQALVLAFSWQPAFCETAPKKRECRSQTAERYDARYFSLHGLWPQPGSNIYCDVDQAQIKADKAGKWGTLKTARIDEAIWQKLKQIMPGVQSNLHKHEWVKHGTCYGGDIDRYYRHSVALIELINGSGLDELFVNHIGRFLSTEKIANVFEADFGKGTANRLRLSCRRDHDSDRLMIVELTLGLASDIDGAGDLRLDRDMLKTMIAASPEIEPGCPGGIVDGVGFQ